MVNKSGISHDSNFGGVGIFISANDRVFEWTLAFLRSFRASNPNLPLYLIPFNEQCDRILRLSRLYDFKLYVDSSFSVLEEIGSRLELGLTPTGPHWFRRFAAFWGPLDEFIYLDCRNLVLSDLNEIIMAPSKEGFDLLHYDCVVDQVYNVGDVRKSFLLDRRARGFNSGRWAARRGLFSLQELQQYAEECLGVRDQMNLRNTDQFFLNYCCDRRGVRTGHLAEVLGDMCQDGWARQPGYVYRAADGYRRWDFGGLNHKKRVPLLHWAGIKLSPAMPEAELFYSFRDAEYGWGRRVLRKLGRMIRRPFINLMQGLRANRWINETYHRMRGH